MKITFDIEEIANVVRKEAERITYPANKAGAGEIETVYEKGMLRSMTVEMDPDIKK